MYIYIYITIHNIFYPSVVSGPFCSLLFFFETERKVVFYTGVDTLNGRLGMSNISS